MAPPNKTELRKRALAARDALSPEFRARASIDAALHADAAIGPVPGVVAVFMPIGSEIDTGPLIARLAARGVVMALPVVVDRRSPLIFRAWAPGEALEPRQWGIREPLAAAAAVAPDVLIVPLAAFDDRGERIGYGAGHYDRSLAALRAAKPVRAYGYAFGAQRVAAIPAEPHDERLDGIVTEDGFLAAG